MGVIPRKIFQPNTVTSKLLENFCTNNELNISDSINIMISEFFTPKTNFLKKEVDIIFLHMKKNIKIPEEELKSALARCVDFLKDHPISDPVPLEQIFFHFITRKFHKYRYDYIQIVNDFQDLRLRHLNDILGTIDSEYNIGQREFGERSETVFKHWNELSRYSEIYPLLALLISLEDIYYPLDELRVIDLILLLDEAILNSKLEPIKTPYQTNVSLKTRYHGINYEMLVYQTDNGYVELSKDAGFDHMSKEIREYYMKIENYHTIYNQPITKKDVEDIAKIEKEGRELFKRLTPLK